MGDRHAFNTPITTGDCLEKHLEKDHAELTGVPYDASKKTVTLEVAVSLGSSHSLFKTNKKMPFSLVLKQQ